MNTSMPSVDAATATFLTDVLSGLAGPAKTLPCKYFYDARGSELFEQICTLDEYYPTRTELGIMQAYVEQMAQALGPKVRLVELGAGSGKKTELLLAGLDRPSAYMPVEISEAALDHCVTRLRATFDELEILPVCADYTRHVDLPRPESDYQTTAAYFPGSTIGNFTPPQACEFLARIARLVGKDGGFLIGVDLRKDRRVLERAYNDERGVTAAFNLNLLERINRELGADFALDRFLHKAVWDDEKGRIEMRLVSQVDQQVHIADTCIGFSRGEFITTEYSYKYTLDGFKALAEKAGFEVRNVWTDDRRWFSVWYLEVR